MASAHGELDAGVVVESALPNELFGTCSLISITAKLGVTVHAAPGR
jgi:hypothetical protein